LNLASSYPKNKLTSINTAAKVGSSILIALAGYSTIFGTASAETGTGTDIFKVILTILGAEKAASGDVVAIVTVNDHSKVKFFEVKGSDLIESSNMSSSVASPGQGKLIEYVATFPNVTVNSGDVYNACALPLKTLKLLCEKGNNSPATRPEIVDLTLGSPSSSDSGDTTDNGVDSEINQSSLSPASDDESD
jgi:hypothetical protein